MTSPMSPEQALARRTILKGASLGVGAGLASALTAQAQSTGAAEPSRWARSQLMAVTHHRSPGTSPGKWYCGIGVVRSLPIER